MGNRPSRTGGLLNSGTPQYSNKHAYAFTFLITLLGVVLLIAALAGEAWVYAESDIPAVGKQTADIGLWHYKESNTGVNLNWCDSSSYSYSDTNCSRVEAVRGLDVFAVVLMSLAFILLLVHSLSLLPGSPTPTIFATAALVSAVVVEIAAIVFAMVKNDFCNNLESNDSPVFTITTCKLDSSFLLSVLSGVCFFLAAIGMYTAERKTVLGGTGI